MPAFDDDMPVRGIEHLISLEKATKQAMMQL